MKINWQIDSDDIRRIKDFVSSQSKQSFVRNRTKKNIEGQSPGVDKKRFWDASISCLITTQQRSGPGSAVTRFICTNPFLLRLDSCIKNKDNLERFVEETITDFGGLRRGKKIGQEVRHNLEWLEDNGWRKIEEQINKLRECRGCLPQKDDISIERKAASTISENMKGFGPKQSRNLWQSLGLTRFEIPIDSRITKWLNQNNFPLKLSANALQDPNYYAFVMDGIQILCENCKVFPCVFDASIFASFDQEWEEHELIW